MQQRQLNRRLYFNELAKTSDKFFVPYISKFIKVEPGMNVLEVGCGDGGNLLPFARMGCKVTGVDMAKGRITDAKRFFKEEKAEGKFIEEDVFNLTEFEHKFDLILCHDVIEHIYDKKEFLSKLKNYLKNNKNGGGGDFYIFPCLANAFRRTPTNM